jgi:phosphomevalonate kinase
VAIVCSAPGKLVLLGEYSVLYGHPAVVMAVDRRARVGLRPASGEFWSVRAPGFEDRSADFELGYHGGFRWVSASPEVAENFGLVERVVAGLMLSGETTGKKLRPASLVLDSRDFFDRTPDGTAKLGLGSSAALTVGLTGAVRRWIGTEGSEEPDAAILRRLLELHRSLQGGRGSGLDLAASLLGGVIEYRLDREDAGASTVALEPPDDLHFVCLWTGRSASTSVFLERLGERLASDDGVIASALAGLGGVARSGVDHLRAADLPGWLSDVDDFYEALEALGRIAGLEIISDEHLRLRQMARDADVHYKPSGAGGGDLGIGFTDDAEAVVAFASRASDAGFRPVELAVDPKGLECVCGGEE